MADNFLESRYIKRRNIEKILGIREPEGFSMTSPNATAATFGVLKADNLRIQRQIIPFPVLFGDLIFLLVPDSLYADGDSGKDEDDIRSDEERMSKGRAILRENLRMAEGAMDHLAGKTMLTLVQNQLAADTTIVRHPTTGVIRSCEDSDGNKVKDVAVISPYRLGVSFNAAVQQVLWRDRARIIREMEEQMADASIINLFYPARAEGIVPKGGLIPAVLLAYHMLTSPQWEHAFKRDELLTSYIDFSHIMGVESTGDMRTGRVYRAFTMAGLAPYHALPVPPEYLSIPSGLTTEVNFPPPHYGKPFGQQYNNVQTAAMGYLQFFSTAVRTGHFDLGYRIIGKASIPSVVARTDSALAALEKGSPHEDGLASLLASPEFFSAPVLLKKKDLFRDYYDTDLSLSEYVPAAPLMFEIMESCARGLLLKSFLEDGRGTDGGASAREPEYYAPGAGIARKMNPDRGKRAVEILKLEDPGNGRLRGFLSLPPEQISERLDIIDGRAEYEIGNTETLRLRRRMLTLICSSMIRRLSHHDWLAEKFSIRSQRRFPGAEGGTHSLFTLSYHTSPILPLMFTREEWGHYFAGEDKRLINRPEWKCLYYFPESWIVRTGSNALAVMTPGGIEMLGNSSIGLEAAVSAMVSVTDAMSLPNPYSTHFRPEDFLGLIAEKGIERSLDIYRCAPHEKIAASSVLEACDMTGRPIILIKLLKALATETVSSASRFFFDYGNKLPGEYFLGHTHMPGHTMKDLASKEMNRFDQFLVMVKTVQEKFCDTPDTPLIYGDIHTIVMGLFRSIYHYHDDASHRHEEYGIGENMKLVEETLFFNPAHKDFLTAAFLTDNGEDKENLLSSILIGYVQDMSLQSSVFNTNLGILRAFAENPWAWGEPLRLSCPSLSEKKLSPLFRANGAAKTFPEKEGFVAFDAFCCALLKAVRHLYQSGAGHLPAEISRLEDAMIKNFPANDKAFEQTFVNNFSCTSLRLSAYKKMFPRMDVLIKTKGDVLMGADSGAVRDIEIF